MADLDRFLKRRAGQDDTDPRITREGSSKNHEIVEPYEDEHGNKVMIDLPERGVNEREVAELWQEQREHEAEQRKEQREAEKQQARQQHIAKLNDPFDRADIELQFNQQMTAHSEQLAADKQRYMADVAHRLAQARQMEATSPAEAARMRQVLEADPNIIARRDDIQSRHDSLSAATQQFQQYQIDRDRRAVEHDMLESVPELGDAEKFEDFKTWLHDEQGKTWGQVESTNDPVAILNFAKAWRADNRVKAAAAKRAKIARTAFAFRGSGSEPDSAAAREALRETGSTTSALRYLQTKRLERS